MIAIQVQAVRVGDKTTLIFTRVLDELSRGAVDEDEEAESAPTDRKYWLDKGSKTTVEMADRFAEMARDFDAKLQLKYNKFYIGFETDGVPFNFAIFRPRRTSLIAEFRIPQSDAVQAKLEEAEFDLLEYDTRFNNYRIRLKPKELDARKDALMELMALAYEQRSQ